MKYNSLQFRMTISMIIIVVLVIIILSYEMLEEYSELLFDNQDQILSSLAQDIIAELDLPPQELADKIQSITHSPTLMRYEQISAKKPILFRIWQDGRNDNLAILSTTEPIFNTWLNEFQIPKSKSKRKYHRTNLKQGRYQYRLLYLKAKTHPDINIIIAIDNSDSWHEIGELVTFVLILGGIAIVVTSIVIRLIISRILSPIKKTSQLLQNVSVNNMSPASLENMSIPAELYAFVDSVKNMLLRLDHAIIQQKQFAADASHELRTPLAVAKSTLQAAQFRPRTNQEYQTIIAETLDDIARMESLIEQLMALAHLDNIANKPEMTTVQLNKLIAETVDKANAYHKTDRVKLNAIEEMKIQGDADDLARMFYNIIDNAIIYGPADKPVTVSVKRTASQIIITIHDQGGNIPQEHFAHLLERFYRIDQDRNRNTGGSGLGLAIAQKIAQYHNANIEITSNPQTGTNVTITIAIN